MELFSEIYGLYYQITSSILAQAPLERGEIQQLVASTGFAESTLRLIPKLLDEQAWPLLTEQDDRWHSRLLHTPCRPVSTLEARWLKSVLSDPRARLFLTEAECDRMNQLLADVPPLYDANDFCYFDRCADGDPYADPAYIRNFQGLVTGLHQGRPQMVQYQTEQGRKRQLTFLPLKLEYSEKDDKFRVHGAQLQGGRFQSYQTLNLGRVLAVQAADYRFSEPLDIDGWLLRLRCREPLLVRVTNERNGLERFLVEFSAYEKESQYDDATDTCRVTIWYSTRDETEVLIKLLSFGPVVQVLSPEGFTAQLKERLRLQKRWGRADTISPKEVTP